MQHVNNISGCVRKEVGQPILYGKTFFFFLLLLAKEKRGFFFSLFLNCKSSVSKHKFFFFSSHFVTIVNRNGPLFFTVTEVQYVFDS